jgi:hypothetical protein
MWITADRLPNNTVVFYFLFTFKSDKVSTSGLQASLDFFCAQPDRFHAFVLRRSDKRAAPVFRNTMIPP